MISLIIFAPWLCLASLIAGMWAGRRFDPEINLRPSDLTIGDKAAIVVFFIVFLLCIVSLVTVGIAGLNAILN